MTKLLTGLVLSLALGASAWGEVWRFSAGTGVGPILLNGDYLSPTKLGLTPGEGIQVTGGYYLKYKEGIETECTGKKISQIVVLSSKFATKNGPVEVQFPGNLVIGSTAQQMQSALGAATQSHAIPTAKNAPPRVYYAYQSQGLGVITEGGKILQFAVFARK
ncbi:hypothetical protein JST97_09985 [bacterium]|nr:hypothetical protein [bacterium]